MASVKTRTALLLDRDGNVIAWGDDAVVRWRQHRKDRVRLGWRFEELFKMNLMDDTDPHPLGALAPRSTSATEDLITKYLRCMLDRVLEEISEAGFTAEDALFCLTVPNIWNDGNKAIMRRCARNAGFPEDDDRLILALEPEAAAQHARVAGIRVPGRTNDRQLLITPGQRLIVADCGGGTIDRTSYRVCADGSLEETGTSSGHPGGGAYVDRAFVDTILIPRLGGADRFRKLQDTCPDGIDAVLDQWQSAKLHITADNDTPRYFSFSADLYKKLPLRTRKDLVAAQDGEDREIVASPEEIRACFDAVVQDVCTLISDQVNELAKEQEDDDPPIVVLLTGGFAASPCLRDSVTAHLGDEAVVAVSPDPQAAIVRGAVHFACRPDTRARRARRTYGLGTSRTFRPGIDLEEDKRQAETDDGKLFDVCVTRFECLVKKGALVPSDHETEFGPYTPIRGLQRDLDLDFYVTDGPAPGHVTAASCRHIGTISIDLRPVAGRPLHSRGVRIFLKFGETEIKARAVLVATGKETPLRLNLETS
ncbi:hypothetical protein BS329_41290 [Amycolatopsis coloradensis]|uniref:Hsp70 family protein n=1 Tax=Amycolatopsis coloradensis TaxID=76021 RepID=A0A1R0KD84_9PSEU|nr:hypothetical protein BS329_41290 [Amycolatopsis coloradensis]